MPSLDDFRPPYHLGAFGCVVVGVWQARASELIHPEVLATFEPLRIGGGVLGMASVLRYDRPPPEHPVAYSEIIAACAVRRGACWSTVPFDLVLDDEFNVDAGRRFYHLPKRLDRTLRLALERDGSGVPRRMTASGAEVAFDAILDADDVPGVTRLVSGLLGAITEHGSIIGAASVPLVRAAIPVRPDAATGRRARVALSVGGRALRPVFARYWGAIDITLGPPSQLASGGETAC